MESDRVDIARVRTLLASGAAFEGELVFDGAVRIDGVFKGKVSAPQGVLIVSGDVDADISVAQLVVLAGSVRGTVYAKDVVEVHAEGTIEADVAAGALYVERGATVNGPCRTFQGDELDHDALIASD